MASDETITLSLSPTTPSAAGPVVVPRELGTVRLDREIGRGGMGAVWLGQDRLLGRQVAVKFLLHAVADETDPHFVRFLEGARLAAGVKHAGLTTLHQADLTGGVPYLVMEYVDGPSLHQLTKRAGALSLPEALAVLQAVCEAVGELHDREIVHRDIKPANVLLDRDGRVYVTDFGLVCPRVASGDRGDRSQAIAGTPSYMAPEMFGGAVSLRSDVYALGVMAYELLSGRLPFEGTLERMVELHRHAPLPRLFLSKGGDGSALEEVLQRATHKEATYRYKTARHFLRALREAVRDAGVWSQGPSLLATRIARFYRDSKTPHTSEPPTPSPTPYFQRLTELASRKHQSHAKVEAPPAPTVEEPVGPPSSIAFDVTCVHCDYNLRGLSPDGRCPECGGAVADSLRPDRLMFADPRWLARIARGLRLCRIGIWALVATPVAFFFSLIWIEELGFSLDTHPSLIKILWVLVFGSPFLAGCVLATKREPGGRSPDPRARRASRVLLLASGLCFFLGYDSMSFALLGLGSASLAWHLRTLALRIPNTKMARRTLMAALTMAALHLLPLAVGVVFHFRDGSISAVSDVVIWFVVPWMVVVLVVLGSAVYASRAALLKTIGNYVSRVPDPSGIVLPCKPVPSGPTPEASPVTESVNDGRATRSESPSAPGTITFDVTCVHCDYNLRSLTPDGKCPECGKPIADSLREDRLMFADRKWLSRMALGQRLLLVAVYGALLPIISFLLVAFVAPGYADRFLGNHITYFIYRAVIMAALCGVLLGILLATRPEPIRGAAATPSTIRRITRFSAWCALATLLFIVIVKFVGAGKDIVDYFWVRHLLFLLASLCGYVGHAANLATRVPDLKRVKEARIVTGMMIVLFLCMAVLLLVKEFAAFMPSGWPRILKNGMALAAFVAFLALLRGLSLSDVLRRHIKRILEARPLHAERPPEPARTVRENPFLELSLRGMPEWELFESDLHRSQALTDLHRTPDRWRFLRSPRYWLFLIAIAPVSYYGMHYCLNFVGNIIKSAAARFGWGAPIQKAAVILAALLALLVSFLSLAVVARYAFRRKNQQRLRHMLLEQGVPVCLGCGYPLRGLPLESARCPECGRPFDERVRELITQADAGPDMPASGAKPLTSEAHEVGTLKARRRTRRAMLIAGLALQGIGMTTMFVAIAYSPMQAWYWVIPIIGIVLPGIALLLFGSRRYRVSPRKSAAESGLPSGVPSPEPALTVRAIPWESSLRGMPELELFESDVQRQLALTDLYKTSAEWKNDWRLSRLIRTRRFWRGVCEFMAIVVVCIAIAELINRFILERWGMSVPFEVLLVPAVVIGGILFGRWHSRLPVQEALRLKLLQQGVPVCVGCGYCLRGLPLESARCPECGRPFDDRVRELLSQTSAGLPGAGSTLHKLHETQSMKRKRRVRRAISTAGFGMMFMGFSIGPIIKAYLPMQRWQSAALSLGFTLVGTTLVVIGNRRYRISS